MDILQKVVMRYLIADGAYFADRFEELLRGSEGVAAIFGYLYKVRACLPGPAGDAQAFGCLACSARDRSGLGGFGGVSSGLERVNQTERVLASTSRFLINALGFIGFVK